MKAIVLNKVGSVDNLQIQEVEAPSITENEVLIESKALSVNPVDYKVRANDDLLSAIYGHERPAILGWDIAGIVKSVGNKVSKFKEGDRVFGMVNFLGTGKAYAEVVASPEAHLSKIPEGISYQEAAASTLAALTALQVLQDKIKNGDRVLIHAGSGGVGHFAVQIARILGAYVISTSSAKNRGFVSSLGAHEHIDYRAQAFEEALEDIDFVFDMFNGEVLHKSVQLVKAGGMVISIPSPNFSDEVLALAKSKNVSLSQHMVQSNGADMDAIAQWLESGALKAHVSQTFLFEDMAKAHLQLESGRTVGKVVVKL